MALDLEFRGFLFVWPEEPAEITVSASPSEDRGVVDVKKLRGPITSYF